ncbi:hypothetical protein CGRA01v4_02478 [Colletotrichum graminicola]|nr:hypothetical protein CGRA01v4_02478 [Colletotrichum graminicola]
MRITCGETWTLCVRFLSPAVSHPFLSPNRTVLCLSRRFRPLCRLSVLAARNQVALAQASACQPPPGSAPHAIRPMF